LSVRIFHDYAVETALHHLVAKVDEEIEGGGYARGIFVDIEGAFDRTEQDDNNRLWRLAERLPLSGHAGKPWAGTGDSVRESAYGYMRWFSCQDSLMQGWSGGHACKGRRLRSGYDPFR
ncbi:hypothetical protein PV326_001756, partial [Microctonus aethiopoides]